MRKFPEYNEVDKSLNTIVNIKTKVKSEALAALGKNFTQFAQKQPTEGITDVLYRLNETLTQIQEKKSTEYDSIPTIRTDLSKLKKLNEDIKNSRRNCEIIQIRADKSSKVAEKAESRFESAKKKNQDTPEFQKIHDEYELALRQKNSNITAFEERKSLLVTEEKNYKKELFNIILSSLSQYVSTKSQTASSLIPLGDQLIDLSSQIPAYTDSTIEILDNELQAVRSEPIE